MEARIAQSESETVFGTRPVDKLSSALAILVVGALVFLYIGRVDSTEGKMIAFSACIATNLAAVTVAGLYRLVTLRRSEVPRGIWLLLALSGMVGQLGVLFLACLIPIYVCGFFSLAGAITSAGVLVFLPASLWFSPLIKEMKDRGARWECGWWLATVALQSAYLGGFVLYVWPNLQGWCNALH